MIVVIDTNVWISALIFGKPGGIPARAIKRAVTEDLLVTSVETLEEVRRVLRRKYSWPEARISRQFGHFFRNALSVDLEHNVHVCRDPKDNMFLECAALAHADVLVTGDNDLLSLANHRDTRILTPAQYLDLP